MNYIKRTIFPALIKHLDKSEITVLIGPRQVGKTVLLEQLQMYLKEQRKIDPALIFYFNLDVAQDREMFNSQTEFIKFLKQKSWREKIYIFIDEAQKVKEGGRFFKGIYDSRLNVKIILTGSSVLEIKAKMQESLTGRKRLFKLFPLSFLEILKAKNDNLYNLVLSKKNIIQYDHQQILNLFYEYCVFGGYPKVFLSPNWQEKTEILTEIYSSYIEKDIIGFLKIQNEQAFLKLIKLLASQTGNLINLNELAAIINTNRQTVERYLLNLEKTFIIYNLPPFFNNPRQEIIKASKIFFIDNGLRNLALNSLQPLDINSRSDKGALLENIILKELLILQSQKYFNLHFWRTKQKAEVDFIIEKGLKIIPLEVKSHLKLPKLSSSFLGFIQRYNPPQGLIVNLNYQGDKQVKQTKVHFIYPYELNHYL